MKPQELRIGNYLWDIEDDYLVTVECIDDSINGFNPNYLEIINPIQLTKEWLLKFGFAYRLKHAGTTEIFMPYTEFKIIYNHITKKYYYIKWNEIKHVHQLQNLYFALTGEELTIKEL